MNINTLKNGNCRIDWDGFWGVWKFPAGNEKNSTFVKSEKIMCLNIRNINSFIADEDIVCYKFFETVTDKDGHVAMVSPYYTRCKWEPGKTKSKKSSTPPSKGRSLLNHYSVGRGYFHSYADSLSARLMCLTVKNRCDVVLWKCIIPKGAKYYRGLTDTGEGSYASLSLRPVEELKRYKYTGAE